MSNFINCPYSGLLPSLMKYAWGEAFQKSETTNKAKDSASPRKKLQILRKKMLKIATSEIRGRLR